jgi:predicted transcriptional regulator of viral defense system
VYRVADFPPGEHEGLVAVWLWSRNEGVFSHETALFLHNLSDALPIRAHVSLPISWKTRVLQIPEGIALHHADVSAPDLSWVGPVPATSVRRTISDCLHASVAPELIAQATAQAAERGLLSKAEILSAPGVSLLQLRSGS